MSTGCLAAEEMTEALGVQVRQAVELLVGALGRGLVDEDGEQLPAHEVYRGAVAVMMRILFLLCAEERGLLRSGDTDSVGGLLADLEARPAQHDAAAWPRLLALFEAVHRAHDGSLFDPASYGWLPRTIDDRIVLHVLRSVVGTGRTLSFRTLDVEQIGYVYEGLLAFDGSRATDVMVGLIGKEDLDELKGLEVHSTVDGLATALARAYKLGSVPRLTKQLAGVNRDEARERLLAVTGGDLQRADRLLPFVGVIRDDLLGRPVVVLPGGLVVTGSTRRKISGTHYTPRVLAEEIVEGALEPLVYDPGPLQTADWDQWVPKTSAEILSLKVADIAMGSGVFLVAAARYLARHLITAWIREGAAPEPSDVDADDDPIVVRARRAVIEHCLYGVDINPMAVDMARLSLWLVSMTPGLPFTFVDDRLAVGDSLLGTGNWAAIPGEPGRDPRLERELAEVASVRRAIRSAPDTDAGLRRKRALLRRIERLIDRASAYADLVSGSRVAAANAGRRESRRITDRVGALASFASLAEHPAAGDDLAAVREVAHAWLATDNPDRGTPRRPLHWPLAFPEVFESGQGGFDAIIGNPPFLGGQRITGTLGTAYREYLVTAIGRGARGSADLVAYFALRAHDLLNDAGQTGLIATNTLAQGDTREVGLDQIVAGGTTIRRAVKSRPWTSRSAILEYCAVWTSRSKPGVDARYTVDGQPTAAITTSLDPASRASGTPYRLGANRGLCFIGSYVLGMGFTLDPDAAQALIEKDDRNREVLSPYLNGQDLNSRPDCSASRWVINFHDWPKERAMRYPDCYDQVLRLVKPERDTLNRKVRRDRWWQFAERAPTLYAAIAGLDRVIVLTLVSRTLQPVLVPTGQVFAHKLAVFATDDPGLLAVLSSAPHYWWAMRRTSTRGIGNAPNYSPSDAFETLPLPPLSHEVRRLGERLDHGLRDVMLARRAGLTATVNLVHDPACQDQDVLALRRTYREIDEALCRAYRWDSLLSHGLDHDFYHLGRETRYTVGPAARLEIVDRLLELNHQRHAEESAGRPRSGASVPARTGTDAPHPRSDDGARLPHEPPAPARGGVDVRSQQRGQTRIAPAEQLVGRDLPRHSGEQVGDLDARVGP
jgi:hypothetical protein